MILFFAYGVGFDRPEFEAVPPSKFVWRDERV